jgi:hypothetical protein
MTSEFTGLIPEDRNVVLAPARITRTPTVHQGDVFGSWTVVALVPPTETDTNKRCWKSICKCECGTERTVLNRSLRSGVSHSCGCMRVKQFVEQRTTHGATRGRRKKHWCTPEYSSWKSMRRRVLNGERWYEDVKICSQWDSFEVFLNDMGKRPTNDHTLDRIDPHGDYTPENCRWATPHQQSNNQRMTIRATFYGMTLSTSEWSRISQVPGNTIRRRLKAGMPIKQAVWMSPQTRHGARNRG